MFNIYDTVGEYPYKMLYQVYYFVVVDRTQAELMQSCEPAGRAVLDVRAKHKSLDH